METEKKSWFDSSVEKAIDCLGKKLTSAKLSERTDEKKLEPVFDIFWEDITKCDRPTDNSDVWFYEPVLKLKNEIVRNSYMSSVEKTYTNWILHLCIKFIDDSSSREVFERICQKYRELVLYNLGLIGHTRSYFYSNREFDRLLQILEWDMEDIWKRILSDKEEKHVSELYAQTDFVTSQKEKVLKKDNNVKTEIPVVLAADNNYAMPMMVTMASMIQTAAESTIYHFYLLVPGGFSENNVEKIKRLCDSSGKCTVKIIDMHSAYKNAYIREGHHITIAAYYRLQIPSLLPEIDKCIYLDVDVVVRDDLAEFWDTELQDYYLFGVRAAGYYDTVKKIENRKKTMGISDFDTYLNSGVLLMNLKKIREDKLERRFAELAEEDWESQDQDILNIACHGGIKLAEFKYNAMTKYPLDDDNAYEKIVCLKREYKKNDWDFGRKSPVIIHYADKAKPWIMPGAVYADAWWSVVSKMPTNVAIDIYNTYVKGMLNAARQIKCTLDICEPLYKEAKKYGALENERIFKYKLQYQNKQQKNQINDLLEMRKEEREKEDRKIQKKNNEIQKLKKKIEKLKIKIHNIQNSKSYKIGRICTFIPRKLKALISRR